MSQIHQLFDYDVMISDHPCHRDDIDSVMDVLHTAMNTDKPAMRISGQDKPAMTVTDKLLKLDKESILYAIRKFSEQTDRIKNPAAYMLTVLYNAPEQCRLDQKNQGSHNMIQENHSHKKETKPDKSKKPVNSFWNFPQRTYDYDALERELLSR